MSRDVANWLESPTPLGYQTCATFQTGSIPVTLAQRGVDWFAVVYGKQVTYDLTYAQACEELGACLLHALACAGKLDNSEVQS